MLIITSMWDYLICTILSSPPFHAVISPAISTLPTLLITNSVAVSIILFLLVILMILLYFTHKHRTSKNYPIHVAKTSDPNDLNTSHSADSLMQIVCLQKQNKHIYNAPVISVENEEGKNERSRVSDLLEDDTIYRAPPAVSSYHGEDVDMMVLSPPPSPAVPSYHKQETVNMVEQCTSEQESPSHHCENVIRDPTGISAEMETHIHYLSHRSIDLYQRQDSGVCNSPSSTFTCSNTDNSTTSDLVRQGDRVYGKKGRSQHSMISERSTFSSGYNSSTSSNLTSRKQNQFHWSSSSVTNEKNCSDPHCRCPHHSLKISQDVLDAAVFEAVGCLMHHDNCHIPMCPCRDVKRRFQHILLQPPFNVPRNSKRPTRKAVSEPYKVQNYYPVELRPHVRQNSEAYRHKFVRRRHSRSMDLTPVIEIPGDSHAATPNASISGSVRDLSSLTSPPSTPVGSKVLALSPTALPVTPTAPPPVLRKISLSADSIPTLCLNDCPMAQTPLQSPQSSRDASERSAPHLLRASPVVTSHTCKPTPLQTGHLKHPQQQKKALLKQEAPSIYCGKCPMPDCMTLISTVSDITSGGVKFFSKSNDFTLDIPRGAVPENERLTLDVGVALFGPFQFPEGLRPVSPVFWVCVRDNSTFQFSKPVTVTIPHFLSLRSDEDVQSLGLTFLKAKHTKNMEGMYEFCEIDGAMKFQTSSKFGVLKTRHFCSLCIACRDTPECLNKTQFCMTSLLPKSAMAAGTKQDAYFFVTFYNLTTCLMKVDELIAEKGLEGHQKSQVGFHFKRFTKKHALEMVITQPKHGKIGVLGKKQVL